MLLYVRCTGQRDKGLYPRRDRSKACSRRAASSASSRLNERCRNEPWKPVHIRSEATPFIPLIGAYLMQSQPYAVPARDMRKPVAGGKSADPLINCYPCRLIDGLIDDFSDLSRPTGSMFARTFTFMISRFAAPGPGL